MSKRVDKFMKIVERKARKVFGWASLRPQQEEVLRIIAARENVFAVLPTGAGKSSLFQLPALCTKGTCVVVSPLVALMKDQVDTLNRLGVPTARIGYDQTPEKNERIMRLLGDFKLVYVSPERVRTKEFMNALRSITVSYIALDEAHCISRYSKDFRPAYSQLASLIREFPKASIIAVTATADRDVERDVWGVLGVRSYVRKIYPPDRPNLRYEVVRDADEHDIAAEVQRSLEDHGGVCIVYCATRKAVDELADNLRKSGVNARPYHAGLNRALRTETQNLFMASMVDCIVATNAFGMGVDKNDVRLVYHFHMPGSLFDYVQEAGRAGRDGKPARCILNISRDGRKKRDFFVRLGNPPFKLYERLWVVLRRFSPANNSGVFSVKAEHLTSKIGLPPVMGGQAASALQFLDFHKHIKLFPATLVYRLPVRNRGLLSRYLRYRNVRVDGNVCVVTVGPGAEDPVEEMAISGAVQRVPPQETLKIKLLKTTLSLTPENVRDKLLESNMQLTQLEQYGNASNKASFIKRAFLQQSVDFDADDGELEE